MKSTDPNDYPGLVELIRKKDPQACEWLYEQYAGAIYAFIGEAITDPVQKSETLQEIFARIYNNIDGYDPSKSRLFTWMMSMARATIIPKLKTVDPGMLQDIQHFGNLVKNLGPEEKQLIHLSWIRGYSIEETAMRMNLTPEDTKEKIRNSMKKINAE